MPPDHDYIAFMPLCITEDRGERIDPALMIQDNSLMFYSAGANGGSQPMFSATLFRISIAPLYGDVDTGAI